MAILHLISTALAARSLNHNFPLPLQLAINLVANCQSWDWHICTHSLGRKYLNFLGAQVGVLWVLYLVKLISRHATGHKSFIFGCTLHTAQCTPSSANHRGSPKSVSTFCFAVHPACCIYFLSRHLKKGSCRT